MFNTCTVYKLTCDFRAIFMARKNSICLRTLRAGDHIAVNDKKNHVDFLKNLQIRFWFSPAWVSMKLGVKRFSKILKLALALTQAGAIGFLMIGSL